MNFFPSIFCYPQRADNLILLLLFKIYSILFFETGHYVALVKIYYRKQRELMDNGW